MKKIFLLAVSCFAILSCSSDDEGTSSASLVGTWKVTSFTTGVGVDFNNDGTASTNFLTESGCYDNSNLIFAANNVATANFQELDIILDIDFVNPENSIYEVDCLPATPVVGTWAQGGNSVTVTIDGEPAVLTINGNTMTAVFDEFVDIETYENGETVYSYTSATMVFTKQ
jgi:hypothetical protein